VAAFGEEICSGVEKSLNSGEWIVNSGWCENNRKHSTIHYPLSVFFILLISYFSPPVRAQQTFATDSLHTPAHYIDSLLKLDSINRALQLEDERRFQRTKQLATQRSLDLTGDSIPEVLRLEGYVKGKVDETRLTFTIKSKGKTLFEDSWLAGGYFDTADHLPDTIKLKRLRSIVTVFFANENFEVIDSNEFDTILKQVTELDVHPHSKEASEIFHEPRVMYSVFHSRDYWYGLIWDPKRNKFVKAWRN
jgi:hypothetical protein